MTTQQGQQKQPSPIQYVRYWSDGQEKYCWLQLTGNEAALKALETKLKEAKSMHEIQWSHCATEREVDVLLKFADEFFLCVKGKFKMPTDIKPLLQEHYSYVHIRQCFVE